MFKQSRKFRLLILAIIVVASLTPVPALAGGPPTSFYLVARERACQLPDATGQPQASVASKVQMTEAAENLLRMDCTGLLPAGSALPELPMKSTFSETKIYCVTWYDGTFLLSKAYNATVLPDGTAEISCAFMIH